MGISSLGYIGIGATDVAAWRDYAGNILGMHVDDGPDGGLRLRIDARAWRIAIEPEERDDIVYAGYEVPGEPELQTLVASLRAAGTDVRFDEALARRRGVMGLARVTDPIGVTCELFWGATETYEKPLILGAGGGPFVTGEQGLGHVVLATVDPPAMLAFYRDLLGFRVSDYIDDARLGQDKVVQVTFLHCNARHHSVAFAGLPAPVKLLHFMLQRERLDDVGMALDRLLAAKIKLSLSLGRHVNDHMVSFYAFTPGGLEVEYGWGARQIEAPHWSVTRHDRISIWGHATVNRPGTGWREDDAR